MTASLHSKNLPIIVEINPTIGTFRSAVVAIAEAGISMIQIPAHNRFWGQALRSAKHIIGNDAKFGVSGITLAEQIWEAKAAGANFVTTPELSSHLHITSKKLHIELLPETAHPLRAEMLYNNGFKMLIVHPVKQISKDIIRTFWSVLPRDTNLMVYGDTRHQMGNYIKAGAAGFCLPLPISKTMDAFRTNLNNIVAEHRVAARMRYHTGQLG